MVWRQAGWCASLGVRQANVDPLGRAEKPYIQELDPAYYGLTDADLDTPFNTGTLLWKREALVWEGLLITDTGPEATEPAPPQPIDCPVRDG